MGPSAGRALLRAALRTNRSTRGSSPQPRGHVSETCQRTREHGALRQLSSFGSGPAPVRELVSELRSISSVACTPGGHLRFQKQEPLVPTGMRGFASGDLPPHEVLTMPSLSPTMTHGNLVEWKKQEGEEVAAGDVLCVIETDKATLDNESQEEGFLAKILVATGSKDVPVGSPIAIMAESAEDIPKFASYSPEGGAPIEAAPAPAQEAGPPPPPEPATPSPAASAPSGPLPNHLGPSVKRLLEQSGIDARTLTGSGPHGIITKGDVLAAIEGGGAPPKPSPSKAQPSASLQPSAPPPPPPKPSKSAPPAGGAPPSAQGAYEDLPNSQIRKVIARRLLESKVGTPHYYLAAEAVIDETLLLRKVLKEKHSKAISVNDFIIKAVAAALKEVPEANASYDEATGEVRLNSNVDICVAVATDRGLMTPIVKGADAKSLSAISSEVKVLAEKARSGKLKPEEFTGGTFTISNLGMFPVDRFNAIINPPQAGILAIGRGNKVAIWEEGPDGTGAPATVTKLEVTLSGDHRVMDGDVAGKFLQAVTSNLADPQRLLL